MTVRQPRYSKEEFARRGNELYERQIRAQVETGNHGKIAKWRREEAERLTEARRPDLFADYVPPAKAKKSLPKA